ncbi:holo-ACP synthase [Bailinhaonella thermotolerans]|uniref:Holo-[acyl-carrier-protein] synthase n=1 Tax=Bailinhaonella thermotolerans TaxID=1070861 RepID=A0A3A4A6L6_9ACTN|nr:holo-ACP synthase [Bailinhaonella thermotolerans]RJL23561.1 holo-ACP synthase [Bailinhaonella thermotolerans]
MIVGIGVDVVDIERFRASLERTPSLAARLFTEGERGLPARSLAARFAAKEAVAKALGAPPGLRHLDAEVRVGEHGRPELAVSGAVARVAAERGVARWHLSLSHDGGVAVAYVIAEGGAETP